MRTESLSRTSVESAFHSSTTVGTNEDLYNSKRHSVHFWLDTVRIARTLVWKNIHYITG